MPENIVELAMKYGEAWAAHDPDAIAALHTDDSVFHLHDISPAATGRDAVREMVVAQLAALPDLKFERVRVHFGANHFVTEYVMSGTTEDRAFAVQGRMCSLYGICWWRGRTAISTGGSSRARRALDPAEPREAKTE